MKFSSLVIREQTNNMHRIFRKGRSTALNIFTVGFVGNINHSLQLCLIWCLFFYLRFYEAGLNGYATLPVNYPFNPIEDGVVLLHATLPGGASRERQGGTLVHEAGHWLGLRHTFHVSWQNFRASLNIENLSVHLSGGLHRWRWRSRRYSCSSRGPFWMPKRRWYMFWRRWGSHPWVKCLSLVQNLCSLTYNR